MSTTFNEIISANYTVKAENAAEDREMRAAFDSPQYQALAGQAALDFLANLIIFDGVPIALPSGQVQPAHGGILRTILANLREVLS